jgi:hypothetical protein
MLLTASRIAAAEPRAYSRPGLHLPLEKRLG